MFLAAAAEKSQFTSFDPFVLIITLIIAIAVVRLLMAPKKNLFAIGFAVVSLLVFLVMDVKMIQGW